MFKVTTKFRDLEGKEVTASSWFNISQREATMINAKYNDNVVDYIQSIISDTHAILTFLEELVLTAYGVRSEDNLRFIKNDQLREDFKNSLEFDQLIIDLLQDKKKSDDFMSRVLNITDKQKIAEIKNTSNNKIASIQGGQPPRPSGNRNRKPRKQN